MLIKGLKGGWGYPTTAGAPPASAMPPSRKRRERGCQGGIKGACAHAKPPQKKQELSGEPVENSEWRQGWWWGWLWGWRVGLADGSQ